MAESIDELQIEINAKAAKANDAIDRLVGKLDILTTSLSKLGGNELNNLANGVQRLGTAMQTMNNIKTTDFTRLASNLTKLSTINVAALNSSANSISHLITAFNGIEMVSANAIAVGELAKNISKLGNKSVQSAIANMPQLATAMNNLMAILSRSPQVSQNVIQMTNALANLASQGQSVGAASSTLTNGLNRSNTAIKRTTKNTLSLAAAFGKFYASYFLVVRGIKKMWSSIEGTADYIEAYNYFNVAMGKIGSDWSYQWEKYGYENAETYSKSFEKRLYESIGSLSGLNIVIGADGKGLLTESGVQNLGLNIKEITQYASQLASITNSVGQTGETSLAISSSFTKLAGDISSLFNVDYSSVAKNLQSGLIGQSRALYKYGIDITNATLQTKAYELGLSKAVSEMTQAEKMQLRTLAILEQSKVSWGDLANTINSPANLLRQFKNNLSETGMVFGQLFIPLMQSAMPVINGLTIALKRLLVEVAGFFGVKIDLDKFGQGYTEIEDDIDGITGAYDDAIEAANKFKSTTLGIDELNINSPQEDTSGSGIDGVGGIDLTDKILEASTAYEDAWNECFANMENASNKWADSIGKTFDKLAAYLSPTTDALENLWENGLSKLSNFAVGGLEDLYNDFLKPLSDWTIGEGIPQLTKVLDIFLNDINWDMLRTNLDKFYVGIEPFVEGIGNGLITFFEGLAKIGAGVINALGEALGFFGDGFQAIGADNMKSIGEFFGILIPTILLLEGATKIPGIIRDLGTSIGDFFTSTAFKLGAWPTEIFALQTLWDTMVSSLEGGKLLDAAKELSSSTETIIGTLDTSIADIDNAHEHYSDMAIKYAELSANYESLTEEEKVLLKQYADELSEYTGDGENSIQSMVNKVTGAWEGTTSELQNAIDKQAEFYKKQAIESGKSELYSIIVKAEIDKDKAYDQLMDFEKQLKEQLEKTQAGRNIIASVGVDPAIGDLIKAYQEFRENVPVLDLGVSSELSINLNKTTSAIREYDRTIENAKEDIKYLDGTLDNLGETAERTGKIVTDAFGFGAIDFSEHQEELDEYINSLDKATDTTNDFKGANDNAKTSLHNLLSSPNCLKLLIDNTDYNTKLGDSKISAIEFYNTFGKIEPTLGANTIPFLKGLKGAEDTWDVAVKRMNGNTPSLDVNTSKAESSISSFVDRAAKALSSITVDLGINVPNAGGANKNQWANISVAAYATGGFPEDGWFRASHGEIMGKFDNGQSVVANNMQIVDGIKGGVKEAVSEILAPYLSQIATNTRETANKDFSVNIGDREIARANARGQKAMGYRLIT